MEQDLIEQEEFFKSKKTPSATYIRSRDPNAIINPRYDSDIFVHPRLDDVPDPVPKKKEQEQPVLPMLHNPLGEIKEKKIDRSNASGVFENPILEKSGFPTMLKISQTATSSSAYLISNRWFDS